MAIQGSGLTTFVSTYVFAGGGDIGSTLSQASKDKRDVMRNVISYDILPYSTSQNKETLIRKLLYGEGTGDDFAYFLIDENKVNLANFDVDAVASDLANMVYSKSTDSASDKLKTKESIKSNFEINTFTDTEGRLTTYASYVYEDDLKFLFFSEIELVRSRIDDTNVRQSVNKVGFIGSASIFKGEIEKTVQSLTINFVFLNIGICFLCILLAMMVSIVASRYLSDNIMDEIINLCIKMKIAQITQAKVRRMHALKHKVEISGLCHIINSDTAVFSKNEFHQLFVKVENILKVFRMKNFVLTEDNKRQYNYSALLKFTEILQMYEKAKDDASNLSSLTLRETWVLKAKYKEAQRK